MYRILIVDDDESIRLLYADEFHEDGYETISMGDASRVMETIEKKRPDLVLLDVRLGKYNGLDLLQDIRNTYYNLPVILCTAYPNFRYDLKSIAADYYVVKSSNLRELKLRVEMALQACNLFLPRTELNGSEQKVALF